MSFDRTLLQSYGWNDFFEANFHALAEQDHPGQALLLDRADPALGVGIQVRALRRKCQRLDLARRKDGPERLGELRVPVDQEIAANRPLGSLKTQEQERPERRQSKSSTDCREIAASDNAAAHQRI